MHRLPVLAATALLIMAFVLPAPVPPPQQLAYRLPSPPTATYHVSDSTRLSMATPMGPVDASGNSSFTFAATFAAEGDGIRVSGELTEFTAQGNEPMRGTTSISRTQAGVGNFDLLLGPQGVTEVVSRVIGAGGELLMWGDPTEAMFPRLPAGEVQPGDTWMDAVTSEIAGSDGERTASYTYTLTGDTIVDGRPQLRVEFSADVQLPLSAIGIPTDEELTGTDTGFFLWDADRGLVVRAEVSRSYEGSIEVPGAPPITMNTTAVTRVTQQM